MEIVSAFLLFTLVALVVPVGLAVLHLGLRQRTSLLAERVGALERRVADSARRLTISEAELARLGGRSRAVTDPAPSPGPAQPVAGESVPSEPPARHPSTTAARPARPSGSLSPDPRSSRRMTATPRTAARPSSGVPIASTLSSAATTIWHWLFGGNTVVRIGVVILFFGVAFFLNYVAERGWLPLELRLVGAAAVGLGLVGIGVGLRHLRRGYALTLQGGGAGIVFLTVFAAVNLYDLVGTGMGLAVMVLLVVVTAALAVIQDARSLAVLATLGGFLGPVLVSRDASHVALFSYYAVLDGGIVAVAWFRAWRVLNLLGFVFTFIVGAMWGVEFYQPAYFATTQPFLIVFFGFFIAVPVLFARRQPPSFRGYVDGTLVFGVPLAAFALQQRLVSGFEHGAAYSAFAAALVYAAVAGGLRWRHRGSLQLLIESFTALAVAFGTLTIPLAFDAHWTSAAWALEGAALVWLAVRQDRLLALGSGLALQLLAGAVFWTIDPSAGDIPVLNTVYLGGVMVSLSGLFSGWCLSRPGVSIGRATVLSGVALTWGTWWWFGAGVGEITRRLSSFDQHNTVLAFVALSVVTAATLRRSLPWRHLAYPPLLLLPAMMVYGLVWLVWASHPLADWGVVVWPLSFMAQYWVLRRLQADWRREAPLSHSLTLWLGVFLLTWEVSWLVEQLLPAGPTWSFVMWALVPLGVVSGLTLVGPRFEWPVRRFAASYLGGGQLPLVLAVAGWVLLATTRQGDPAPLGYLPLLNPLELVQVGALGLLWWWSAVSVYEASRAERRVMVGLLAFATLNGVIARATHFLGDVPFDPAALWSSALFQTSLSIVWTAVAFVLMLAATRRAHRNQWWVGAALLTGVVTKLFSVDLADIGTVARIVSFVVVGGLILVIGYVSPLPPKEPSPSRAPAQS